MTTPHAHLAETRTPRPGTPLVRAAAAWLFGLLAVIAAGIITIQLVSTNLYGPQQPIRDYLQAMRDGNGAKALGLLRANIPPASPALLDGEALKQAAAGIEDVKIGQPQNIGNQRVKINVAYSADNTPHSADFTLEPVGTEWMFFSKWQLTPITLPTMNVSVVNSEVVEINNVTVGTPGGRGTFATFFPGNYRASLQGPLFEAPERVVLVENGKSVPQTATLITQPSAALNNQVDARLKEYLDGCSRQAVLLPTGCPLGWRTANRVASPITWTITEYPQAQITAYGGGWSIAPLSLKARITFTEQNNLTGAFRKVDEEESYGFSAKLTINGDSVNVTPVVQY